MTVRTSTILASLVLNTGVSVDELAKVSGVAADAIRSPTFVSYEEGIRLWEAAEAITGDPAVGLIGGSRITLDQLGVLMSVFVHAADVRDALERLARVLPLAIRPATIEVRDEPDGASFLYVSPSEKRHGVDAMLSAVVMVLRQCTQRDVLPIRVAFQAPRPPSFAPYEACFGVRPIFGQRASSLTLARADLTLPMRGAEPLLAKVLEEHASATLRPASGPSSPFEDRLRVAIRTATHEGDGSVSAVARRLGVSVRSLQRRLSTADSSFSAAKDAALSSHAEELLARDELSLEHIAQRLGFASRTSFERAYRRWTGRSPASARRDA